MTFVEQFQKFIDDIGSDLRDMGQRLALQINNGQLSASANSGNCIKFLLASF